MRQMVQNCIFFVVDENQSLHFKEMNLSVDIYQAAFRRMCSDLIIKYRILRGFC